MRRLGSRKPSRKAPVGLRAPEPALKLRSIGGLVAFGAVAGAALCGASVFAARPYLPPPPQARIGGSVGGLWVPASRLQCLAQVSPHFPQGGSTASAAVASTAVLVEIIVSRTGTVSPVRLLSGPVQLEAEAMSALRQWHYRPYLVDGLATAVTTEVTVTFTPGLPGGMISHPGT